MTYCCPECFSVGEKVTRSDSVAGHCCEEGRRCAWCNALTYEFAYGTERDYRLKVVEDVVYLEQPTQERKTEE